MPDAVRTLIAVLPLLAAAASAPSQSAPTPDSFEATLERYRAMLQRPSLHKRTDGRRALAATRDPRALDVLVRSYDRPEEPQEVVRHLIVSITMGAFGRAADPAALATWRDRHDDAADAWLWHETLAQHADQDLAGLRDLVLGRRDPYLRAAALGALATRTAKIGGGEEVAAIAVETLDTLPRKPVEKALLIEGVAALVLAQKAHVRSDDWRGVAELLIRHLDEKDTPHRSKVTIARHLARTLDSPNLGLEARWWLGELDRQPRKETGPGRTVTVPFVSLRTTGFRFAYVIDASDSMLARVTDREKKELGPTTGGPSSDRGDTGFVPEVDDIDWNRVITRFDAAREFLRVSLKSLTAEHEFVVVLFGDEARHLAATPKLVKASSRNIAAALAELDGLQAGPPTAERPEGQLLGRTNLHAGLTAAFGTTGGGSIRKDPYVDDKGLLDGCDTVFLLSDGAPSWDDHAASDSRDPEDQAGDPETGVQYTNVPTLIFQGPFGSPPFDLLVADVRRMNLFRKAEIHCVGIGEANHALLKQIADVGLGRAIRVEGERR